MKKRLGFVSNSSSSSFVISLADISAKQLGKIMSHTEVSKGISGEYDEDAWEIEVFENTIRGSVFMDNFDMSHFLREIGVKDEDITWRR